MRWNVSSKGKVYRAADSLVISIPKSGRTWLRALVCSYACKRAGLEVRVDDEVLPSLGLPDVRYTHELWEHRTTRLWDRLRGKHLLAGADRTKPIVLLARDPRDVIVSLYHHMVKREHRFEGPLADFLRHPELGLGTIIDVMNAWWSDWREASNVLLVRYEDCRAETVRELDRMLRHLGFGDVDGDALEAAVEYSRFENMQRMESKGAFQSDFLQAGDTSDKDSFKVRRGKIGGYRDEMGAEELAFVEAECARLDPAFGYGASPAAARS